MIQLTTDLSEPLLDLLRAGQAPVDGVEVGPWFSVERIAAYRQALPGLPFTFHGSDLVERVGFIPGAVGRIAAYYRASGGPWLSMHMTMWPPGMIPLLLRGWRLPRVDPERATRRFVRQIGRLAAALPVPLILENVPALRFPGYEFETEPARIRRVLDETGCGLLLDIGHARIAAQAFGQAAESYLEQLPLERTVQIHASGVRSKGGRTFDAHEPLEEADYALLDFLLSRTRPRVLTLEYIRQAGPLRRQLARLRAMLASAPGPILP